MRAVFRYAVSGFSKTDERFLNNLLSVIEKPMFGYSKRNANKNHSQIQKRMVFKNVVFLAGILSKIYSE